MSDFGVWLIGAAAVIGAGGVVWKFFRMLARIIVQLDELLRRPPES